MICKNCGQELPDGAKFCLNCGTPLFAPSVAEVGAPAPASKLRMSDTFSPAPAAVPSNPAPSAPAGNWSAPSAPAAAPSNPAYTTPAAAPAAPSAYEPQAYDGYYNAPTPAAPQPEQQAQGYGGYSNTPAPAAQPPVPPSYGTAPVPAATYCANCGALIPSGIGSCARCGQPVARSTPKKRSKKLLAGLLAGAAALALAVVGIVIFMNKQTGGPIRSICSAAENTLKAGCTITAYENGYNAQMDGTVSIKADPGTRELIVVSESDYSFNAIYKGYEIYQYRDYYGDYDTYKYDISDEIDTIFDVYQVISRQDARSLDLEKFCDRIDPSGEAYDELCDHVDEKVFRDCLQELVQKLNDRNWLEENAGLTVTNQNGKTTYTFNLTVRTCKKLLKSALEILKPAFRDEDEYEEYYYEINDIRPFDGAELKLSFIVEENKLVALEYETDAGYYSEHIVLKFVNIGTTTFDTDKLDALLEQAYRGGWR